MRPDELTVYSVVTLCGTNALLLVFNTKQTDLAQFMTTGFCFYVLCCKYACFNSWVNKLTREN